MQTLEVSPGMTTADEERFYALLAAAQVAAEVGGQRPIGGYAPPHPTSPFFYRRPAVTPPLSDQPGGDWPPTRYYTTDAHSDSAPAVSAATHEALTPGEAATPVSPPTQAPQKNANPPANAYYGDRVPQHFDDEPAGPPLHFSREEGAISHRFSNRRPKDHRAKHRLVEQHRVRTAISRFIGYVASTSSITAGVLILLPGVVH